MSDFQFDMISDAEYQRQLAIYRPFTDAVRRLIDAGIRTGVDEATIAEAQAAIESVTERLVAAQRTSTSTLRHEETGRPLAYANPAVGVRNAISPPMEIVHEGGDDRRCWA